MRALIAEGAPRKALNMLGSEGLHSADDPQVFEKLEALHPHGAAVDLAQILGSVEHGLPPLDDYKFWTDAVLKGVADFPRGSSPGPSGLRPGCLYDLLKRGPHVSKVVMALAALVAILAHGKLPNDLAPLLGGANLIPLRKPDGGVRPIAVGETIRRLVGKVLMHVPKLMGEMRALAPIQCGVGVTNACESIGQGLQALIPSMPEDGDWVVLQIDVSNAFNTIDRTGVLKGTAERAPTMYPFLKSLYGQPAFLFCQGRVMLSRTGVHQGCPLGPGAFAVGIQSAAEVIQKHHLTWGVFYLDDGVLIGLLKRVRLPFCEIQKDLQKLSFSCKPT